MIDEEELWDGKEEIEIGKMTSGLDHYAGLEESRLMGSTRQLKWYPST
jgi:hypothetical protein